MEEIRVWENPSDKAKYEAYTFKCKYCGTYFVMDGLQIHNLQTKYESNYKEPSKCLSCRFGK